MSLSSRASAPIKGARFPGGGGSLGLSASRGDEDDNTGGGGGIGGAGDITGVITGVITCIVIGGSPWLVSPEILGPRQGW